MKEEKTYPIIFGRKINLPAIFIVGLACMVFPNKIGEHQFFFGGGFIILICVVVFLRNKIGLFK